MYVDYFQLTKRPFSQLPSSEECVLYPSINDAFIRCCDGIDDCNGPVLIIGPSGCGKSTLINLLENKYCNEFRVLTLKCAAISNRQELIQCLMFELGLPFQTTDVGELRLSLIDNLKSSQQSPDGLLLLIDEAHILSYEVLEELRMITNLVCGGKQQVRLVLAGGPPLDEKLGHPQMETLNQRIGVRCYLGPMTSSETTFFVLTQIQLCGRDGREIFQPSAIQKIYDITGGIPRFVAQLCNHALKTAHFNAVQQIDPQLVQFAWCDLQQLPMPPDPATMHDNQTDDEADDSSVVEFGDLDDAQLSVWAESTETTEEPESTPIQADANEMSDSGLEPQPEPETDVDDAPYQDGAKYAETSNEDDSIEEQLDNLLRQLNDIQFTQATQPPDGTTEASGSTTTSEAAIETSGDPSGSESMDMAPSESSASNQDTAQTPTVDELFGSAFENEEPVHDTQSQRTIEQNKSSIELSNSDLENLQLIDSMRSGIDHKSHELSPVDNPPPDSSTDVPSPETGIDPIDGPSSPATDSADDNEIVIVSKPHDDKEASEDPGNSSNAPSTGQVIRMDYRDLFQQLKADQTPQND